MNKNEREATEKLLAEINAWLAPREIKVGFIMDGPKRCGMSAYPIYPRSLENSVLSNFRKLKGRCDG